MRILVLNCGSSSLKYQLFDMADGQVLAAGLVERIAESMGSIKHKRWPDSDAEEVFKQDLPVPDHHVAMRLVAQHLTDEATGVIADLSEIDGVGHRIVHGGESFSEPAIIDAHVIDEIRAAIPLAPLHNPGHLAGIEVARELMPSIPQVTVFDTAFHQTMPRKAWMYPLPKTLYEELRVRRYGFHGTSHRYVAKAVARMLGKAPEETNCITAHLGNGCSMAAVKNGKCIDTSMGLTPLAGLMMGTRCGDVDPAVIKFLVDNKHLTIDEIDTIMNKESGLKGVCGLNDMRDIHAAREKGDQDAQLAVDMFAYRVTHFIGAYLAALDGCDAIAFTAGIGENDSDVRELACATLGSVGAILDPEANRNAPRGKEARISTPESPINIFVIPTNEELEIATQTLNLISAQ